MKLSEYILLPREQRVSHIDLETQCDLQGRKARNRKQPILDFLGVENDIENWTSAKVHRCHLCECNSKNGWCANPLHYYIGTAAENTADHRAANPDYINPLAPGMSQFINEDGEAEVMSCEGARARGLKGATAGRATFFDPGLGTCIYVPVEEARARGLRGANAGRAQFRNPDTNELVTLPVEEGKARGWKGSRNGEPNAKNQGHALFRDPETGEVTRLSVEEGKARGWKGNLNGHQFPRQKCPHCDREVSSNNFSHYHGPNCVERVGSDRWLAAREKATGVTLTPEERAFVTAWA